MPPRSLFSAPTQYLWLGTDGNLLIEGWMRQNNLSYKRFWTSFVNWCIAIAERRGHEPETMTAEEQKVISALRKQPLDGGRILACAHHYHDTKFVRGGLVTGEVKIDGDVRDIYRGHEKLRRKIFTEEELRAQQLPTRAEHAASRHERKLKRRAERREDNAAAHTLVSLARPGVLGPLSSLGLALRVVSARPPPPAAPDAGRRQGMEHGALVVRGVEGGEGEIE